MTTVSSAEYRRAIGLFATGVTVVTTVLDGQPRGMTANAVTSVSLDPMLLLVCVDRRGQTYSALRHSGVFAVNILAGDQGSIAKSFATTHDPTSDFYGVKYRPGKLGAPLLDGVLASIECQVSEVYRGGDHDIFIGEIEALEIGRPDAEPLLFFGSAYGRFAPLLEAGGPPRQERADLK